MSKPGPDLPRLPLLALCAALAVGCEGERPDPGQCPAGTIPNGGLCVRPDSGEPAADAGLEDSGGADGSQVNPDADVRPDAGEGQATLSKSSLDFGRTVVGRSAEDGFEIRNDTSAAVLIRAGLPSGAGAADYAVSTSVAIGPGGLTLAPGQLVSFTVSFTPRAVGSRAASLEVQLCEAGCAVMVTVTGEGLLDPFDCAPVNLDFGLVNPGACQSEQVSCANVSDHPAAILQAGLAAGSSPAFSLTSTAGATVAGGATFDQPVLFCPTTRTREQGTLEILTDHADPARRVKAVALAGTGGGPDLSCTPSTLAFGLVASGQSRTLAVACSNSGDGTLNITNVSVSGPSAAFTYAGGSTFSLGAGQSQLLQVVFAPVAAGVELGTLEVASDDRDQPSLQIPLSGEAVDPNGCLLTLSPAAVDFGAVLIGRTGAASVVLTNGGSGDCGVTIVGFGAGSAVELTLVTAPGSQLVGAGGSLVVELGFAPTAAGARSGVLELLTTDLNQPAVQVPLSGAGIDASFPLGFEPSSIDFGAQAVGCTNPLTRELTLLNGGATPRTVTVSLASGTPGDFSVNTATVAQVQLAAGGAATVVVGFQPAALGARSGRLALTTPGLPVVYLPVQGEGAAQPINVQTFGGVQSSVVDLLLVVDNSGSMAEEQQRLAVAAATLLARADASGADYHIGVTTTDPTDPGPPATVAGVLRGNPTFVTPLHPSRLALLETAINQGTAGSAFEQGLGAAAEAVSNPQLLAGSNAGFLRANGELAVLVISDEEDQSADSVLNLVGRMRNRPTGQGVRLYAISGTRAGCNGPGGFADPEQRYSDAAQSTGGFSRPICEVDYVPILTEIADAIFNGARPVYQLGSTPAPGSVSVTVNGVPLPARTGTVTRWGVDYPQAQLVFLPGRAPGAGQTLEVSYASVCVPASCGDGAPQAGEQCDDGNPVDTDACPTSCYSAACGDLFVRANQEQCDDGNTLPGDGCNVDCIIEGCGNGFVEPPEQCDNGTANSDTAPDACRTTCVGATCGDTVVDTGEQCDDGNQSNTDACVGQCRTAVCGDGFVRSPQEQCDDGNLVDTDACRNNCTFNQRSYTLTTQALPLVPTPGGVPITFPISPDDDFAVLPIGFSFEFLGTAGTDVYLSTNGFISFGAGSSSLVNTSFPTASAPNGLIAWWWDDLHMGLDVGAGLPSATTSLLGTAPNRIRTITLLNVARYAATPGGSRLNVELRLHESTNVVEVHYGALGGAGTAFSASAGWEDANGLVGQNVLGCTTGCALANWPASTVYRYTP